MEKKYKLTDETLYHSGRTLHRIEALKDFEDVNKGDKGGWVESEDNLSHDGDCWIYDDAKVFENARIYENAHLYHEALVFDNAEIYGNARVAGNARIVGKAKVYGYAGIDCFATVCDNVEVFGGAHIYGSTFLHDHLRVSGGSIKIDAVIWGDATITCNADFEVFKNNWSSERFFVYTKSNKAWSVGCFYGTGKDLIKKAYGDSELSGQMYEKYVQFVEQLEA